MVPKAGFDFKRPKYKHLSHSVSQLMSQNFPGAEVRKLADSGLLVNTSI